MPPYWPLFHFLTWAGQHVVFFPECLSTSWTPVRDMFSIAQQTKFYNITNICLNVQVLWFSFLQTNDDKYHFKTLKLLLRRFILEKKELKLAMNYEEQLCTDAIGHPIGETVFCNLNIFFTLKNPKKFFYAFEPNRTCIFN